MTQTLTVRATGRDDAAALTPLEPRPGLVAELLDQVGPDVIMASAWLADEPQGWGVLDLREDELSPELAHVFVAPGSRRQGAGRAISSWLEDEARRRGLKEVFLLVDPEKESAAIPLYLELDYTPTGDHMRGEVVETGEQTHQAIYRKSLTIAR